MGDNFTEMAYRRLQDAEQSTWRELKDKDSILGGLVQESALDQRARNLRRLIASNYFNFPGLSSVKSPVPSIDVLPIVCPIWTAITMFAQFAADLPNVIHVLLSFPAMLRATVLTLPCITGFVSGLEQGCRNVKYCMPHSNLPGYFLLAAVIGSMPFVLAIGVILANFFASYGMTLAMLGFCISQFHRLNYAFIYLKHKQRKAIGKREEDIHAQMFGLWILSIVGFAVFFVEMSNDLRWVLDTEAVIDEIVEGGILELLSVSNIGIALFFSIATRYIATAAFTDYLMRMAFGGLDEEFKERAKEVAGEAPVAGEATVAGEAPVSGEAPVAGTAPVAGEAPVTKTAEGEVKQEQVGDEDLTQLIRTQWKALYKEGCDSDEADDDSHDEEENEDSEEENSKNKD